MITVEALAEEMSRLDDSATVFEGSGLSWNRLAAALLPFIERHIAAGQQGDADLVLQALVAAGHVDPSKVEQAREIMRPFATPKPAVLYDRESIASMLESGACVPAVYSPASIAEQVRLLRAADNAAAAGVHTASKPAGAVPLPEPYFLAGEHVPDLWEREALITYGDAREAAAGGVPAERIEALAVALESREGVAIHLRTAAAEVRGLIAPLPQQPTAEGTTSGDNYVDQLCTAYDAAAVSAGAYCNASSARREWMRSAINTVRNTAEAEPAGSQP